MTQNIDIECGRADAHPCGRCWKNATQTTNIDGEKFNYCDPCAILVRERYGCVMTTIPYCAECGLDTTGINLHLYGCVTGYDPNERMYDIGYNHDPISGERITFGVYAGRVFV